MSWTDRMPVHEPKAAAETLADLSFHASAHLGYSPTISLEGCEDPRQWSFLKKWCTTMWCSLLCLTVALGSAMPTGDLRGQAEDLGVSSLVINLSISLFVVGFGIGPLAFAPLSQVVGRKLVYSISLCFFFIFTLPSCLARNIETMLIARLLAGTAASAPMANVGGTITDIWAAEDRGFPMAIFSASIFLGPCLGPLFGGWIALKTHQWRWIYWVLFILTGIVSVTTFFAPETLASVLTERKTKRSGEPIENSEPLKSKLKVTGKATFQLMLFEPIIICMTGYLSFIYALLYALFFAFPVAFEEIRGWDAGFTGLSFLSIIIGIVAALCVAPVQEKLYRRRCINGPIPEARLYPLMLGAIVLPVSLFTFAFTSAPGMTWVGPCAAGLLFGFSMVLVYISANSYIVDSYSNEAASAIAAKTFVRSLIGATVPIWINPLYHALGFQYAGLLLALIACAIVPIPFVFYFYGSRVRFRSTRATKYCD